MALDLHHEDSEVQTDNSRDKSFSERWNSAPEVIADCDRDSSGDFQCNICLEFLHDPVLTLCGHLYCWPCIYKWIHYNNASPRRVINNGRIPCPVCKTEITQSSLIPVYGRTRTTTTPEDNAHNGGTVIPPRPRGPVSVDDLPRSFNNRAAAHDDDLPRSFNNRVAAHDADLPRSFNNRLAAHNSERSYNTTIASQPAATLQFNAFSSTHGVFGQLISSIFGNPMTNAYAANSYGLAWSNNPRVRRRLMPIDRSLSRICLFLFCCTVLCLLLF